MYISVYGWIVEINIYIYMMHGICGVCARCEREQRNDNEPATMGQHNSIKTWWVASSSSPISIIQTRVACLSVYMCWVCILCVDIEKPNHSQMMHNIMEWTLGVAVFWPDHGHPSWLFCNIFGISISISVCSLNGDYIYLHTERDRVDMRLSYNAN